MFAFVGSLAIWRVLSPSSPIAQFALSRRSLAHAIQPHYFVTAEPVLVQHVSYPTQTLWPLDF